MKHFLLPLLIIVLLSSYVTAQNDVNFIINHQLANEAFAYDKESKNNMDLPFIVERLEYYISQISVTHDGGIVTPIEDLYILVRSDEEVSVSLGSRDITQVEAIKFYIGVEEANNHADPTSFAKDHPLSPKMPSMHWGWAAGYRFLALEGKGDDNLSRVFEIHGLGDDNYFNQTIDVSATAENGVVDINIFADYTQALYDIKVNTGVFSHGEKYEAKEALENFRDKVFTANMPTNTYNVNYITKASIGPNPTNGNIANLQFSSEKIDQCDVVVRDMSGRVVKQYSSVQSNTNHQISIDQPGAYLVSLISNGLVIGLQKLIVTQ